MKPVHTMNEQLDKLSSRQVFWLVLLPLLALYLATTTRSLPYQIDAFTNALTASSLGGHQTFFLDEDAELARPENFGNVAWVVAAKNGHFVSMYPPGASLLAAPSYILAPPEKLRAMSGNNRPGNQPVDVLVPSVVPASLTASVATALAVAILAVVFCGLASPATAVKAGYVAGLGTGAWSVASDSLWQHGPAMLWIALGLHLLSKEKYLPAGLMFGLAILTRPPIAVIAATAGLWIAFTKRSLKPALFVGLGSSVGLAALLGYNWAIFGAPSISGGYGAVFTTNALHSGLWWYLKNIAGALFNPSHGLFIWAPFLIFLLPGLTRAWKTAPAWVRGAAIGGLLYLLLQLKANRFSGGNGHFAYRYPLEALTAAAPLLLFSWREWVAKSALRTRLFQGATVLAVTGQSIGAIPR